MSDAELWKDVSEGDYEILAPSEETIDRVLPSLPEDSINLFDKTQTDFYNDDKTREVLNFIKRRRLDTAKNRPDTFYLSYKDFVHKNRLVIPFKDERGKIIFYQSRKVFEWDDGPNYTSKMGGEKSIIGIDRVSTDFDTVFLFEGPIDSFFVRNGLGLAGINVSRRQYTKKQEEQMESLQFYQKIWVLDSQWLDKTAMEKTEILIQQGEMVFIWPEKYGKRFKDLNEMCVHYKLDEVSPEFITKNSSRGLSATVKFKLLKEQLK